MRYRTRSNRIRIHLDVAPLGGKLSGVVAMYDDSLDAAA